MGWWQRMRKLWPTREELRRMAWHPSVYAPTAHEILTPPRHALEPDILKRTAARDLVWENGCVIALSLTGRSFIAHGAELLATHPIRTVRLIAVAFLIEELIRCPHLAQLQTLDLRGNAIDESGRILLRDCRSLARVKVKL